MPSRADVVIRTAAAADLPGLEWDGEYTHYRRVFRLAFDDSVQGGRILLVAAAGGQMIGQVFVQLNSADTTFADGWSRGYLYSLRVRSAWQGRGIGSRLLDTAETRLSEKGFTTAVIAAAKTNPDVKALYERRGYRVFAHDPGCWSYIDADGHERQVEEPCWLLEKNLRHS